MKFRLLLFLGFFSGFIGVSYAAYTAYGYVGWNVYCFMGGGDFIKYVYSRYSSGCPGICDGTTGCQAYLHTYYRRNCALFRKKCITTYYRYVNYWYYEYQEKTDMKYLHRPDNLAYKKPTKQSKTKDKKTKEYGPGNAVDGKREIREERWSSAFVDNANPHNWWYVDLQKSHDIARVFVLNPYAYYVYYNMKIYVAGTVKVSGTTLSWGNATLCGTIGSSKKDLERGKGKWFHCPLNSVGRYVIVEKKPPDYYLVLSEVEVYERRSLYEEIGFERSASMYGAVVSKREPDLCLDGWDSPYPGDNSVFRTVTNDPSLQVWWAVDLGDIYQIRRVSVSSSLVMTRFDTTAALSYAHIFTSTKFSSTMVADSTGNKQLDKAGYQRCGGVVWPEMDVGTHASYYCHNQQIARYVVVEKKFSSMKPLQMTNVEILGHKPIGNNLALYKSAMQVNNPALGNAASAKGSDGQIAPNGVTTGLCVSTPGSGKDWWTVDLKKTYRIQKVVITNVKDSNKPLGSFRIVSSELFDATQVDKNDFTTCFETGIGYALAPESSWKLDCRPNYGRYVTVMKTVTGTLDFCELEVFGSKHDSNLAYGRPTTQSTTYWKYASYLAVNGDARTKFSDGSCSQTLKTQTGEKWWSVDLGRSYKLGRVKITNIQSCGANCLRKFKILVTEAFDSKNYGSSKFQLCYDYTGTMAADSVESLQCTSSVTGRYVIIQTFDTSYSMTICEVEIYSAYSWPNLALKKPTRSSGDASGGKSNKAVDGWRNPDYAGGSCAMTTGSNCQEWISVDLQAKYIIRKVIVVNRGDAWSRLMKNVAVGITETFDHANFDKNKFESCASIPSAAAGETKVLHCSTAVVGQYVVVRKKNPYQDSPLALCELEVYGSPYRENLALRKASYQGNKMYSSSDPSFANDGIVNPNYAVGKRCTSTSGKNDMEWWAVDLVNTYTVSSMVMLNSEKCTPCGFDAHKGLEGIDVRVTRELFVKDIEMTAHYPCFKNTHVFPPGEVVKGTCAVGAIGRYVIITKSPAKGKPLVLCEVEVYGKAYSNTKPNRVLKKVAMLSTEGSGKADSSQGANDGVPNPKKNCAKTKGINKHEWWLVDMDYYYNIERVIIANTHDKGVDNLKGVDILLSMDFTPADLNYYYPGAYAVPKLTTPSAAGPTTTPDPNVTTVVTTTEKPTTAAPLQKPKSDLQKCAEITTTVPPGQYLDIKCTNNVTGRYMIFMKNNTVKNALTLCEVEAFGNQVIITTTEGPSTTTSTEPPPSPSPEPATTSPPVTIVRPEPEAEPGIGGVIAGCVVGVLAVGGMGAGGYFGFRKWQMSKAQNLPGPKQIQVNEAHPGDAAPGADDDELPDNGSQTARSLKSIHTQLHQDPTSIEPGPDLAPIE